MITSGVYPVFENKFKIGTATDTKVSIADLETFSVSMDNNVEEWTPMDTEGWIRRLMTGKAFTISLSGKRNVGDAGNDFVAGLSWKTGQNVTVPFEWEFPNGDKLAFSAVINVTTPGGGDSTNVDALEFDAMSDGKPTYTPKPTE
ncbi:hypothetical protein SAMN04515656_10344 [Eubacterium aggregans]|uniref:Phage tail tube protein n=1 Tax=Eubacterium aggregans TaxID=81409 RepID=A0A1H3Y396_9FIRM|nr:hypothetical protein [Eubacterium aggregans]SEA06043.1 hypothetical protein SAMN04515656_10344 [Eubacterium aggregans]